MCISRQIAWTCYIHTRCMFDVWDVMGFQYKLQRLSQKVLFPSHSSSSDTIHSQALYASAAPPALWGSTARLVTDYYISIGYKRLYRYMYLYTACFRLHVISNQSCLHPHPAHIPWLEFQLVHSLVCSAAFTSTPCITLFCNLRLLCSLHIRIGLIDSWTLASVPPHTQAHTDTHTPCTIYRVLIVWKINQLLALLCAIVQQNYCRHACVRLSVKTFSQKTLSELMPNFGQTTCPPYLQTIVSSALHFVSRATEKYT